MFFRFDEFVDEVMDCIKDYMPEEYQDYSYELQTINKGTKSYTGLVIRDKDAAGATPVINLDNVYKDYEHKGKHFKKLVKEWSPAEKPPEI